jgi:hypothetical protein
MKLKCLKCGNDWKFYGEQRVYGTVLVIVDGKGNFLRNDTDDGQLDTSSLDANNPVGPWICALCESKNVEEQA